MIHPNFLNVKIHLMQTTSILLLLLSHTAALMSSTPSSHWRALLKASIDGHRHIKGQNYVQFATVSPDLKPKNRMLVFRGFAEAQNTTHPPLKFITDSRSNKISDLSHNPSAEVVYWFQQSQEQYRISGTCTLVTHSSTTPLHLQERLDTWSNLRGNAKEQFFWVNEFYEKKTASQVPVDGLGVNGEVLPPPNTFVLVLFKPTNIGLLTLTDSSRIEWDGDEGIGKRLN